MSKLVLISVFVVATCGLIYELLAGTLASYLLGDSVLQFSTVIGTYMFALGIGSWLSKYINNDLPKKFVQLQTSIGFLGGLSAVVLFVTFGQCSSATFRVTLYLMVTMIGTLVGLEIPMLLRILRDQLEFKDLVSHVLSLDYVGSLLASLLFPLFLVPNLGLINTACLFGTINVLVGLGFLRLFNVPASQGRWLKWQAVAVAVLLIGCMCFSGRIMKYSESYLYGDNVIISKASPYQRLIVTRARDDIRLYLNNNLQFSSKDEYRYHEALVHPVLDSVEDPRHVLVLGGGDGLAAMRILQYPSVQEITLVDLDPAMTDLFSRNELMRSLNRDSLNSPKVKIINQDAFIWLNTNRQKYDAVIVDFPDPSNFSVGKLYTTTFYNRLKTALAPGAVCVVQSTSPLFARKSFWCIKHTIASVGFHTYAYHLYVPSFGDWGYCLASLQPLPIPACKGERYLTPESTLAMFNFSKDIAELPTEINELYSQALVRYYDAEWRELMR